MTTLSRMIKAITATTLTGFGHMIFTPNE